MDSDHLAAIPYYCSHLLKGWSSYLLSAHILDSDLVSLTPRTVFDIQQVLDKCEWDK